VNRGVVNGREVVRHHDRIREQTGLLADWRTQLYRDAAAMTGATHLAGNHRDNDLWETCLQLVGLDNRAGRVFADGDPNSGKGRALHLRV
jgi:hypothetical protein